MSMVNSLRKKLAESELTDAGCESGVLLISRRDVDYARAVGTGGLDKGAASIFGGDACKRGTEGGTRKGGAGL